MTKQFIIDENVAILAQKAENDRGEADNTCRQLIENIIEICHTLVFDGILWDKFYQQLSNLPPDQPFGPRSLLRMFHLALERSEKIRIIAPAAPYFPEEKDIPQGSQDDLFIVRLAVATRATLVTADTPLREHLAASGIQSRYNLSILSPAAALSVI